LTFEMLYVMFSRVRLGSHFRCVPLTLPSRTKSKLSKLRPNIFAVRWRMDVQEYGKWVPHQEAERTKSHEVHKPKARKATKAVTQKKQELRKQQQQAATVKAKRAIKALSSTKVAPAKSNKKRKPANVSDNEGSPKKLARSVCAMDRTGGGKKRKLPMENATLSPACEEPPNRLPVLSCNGSALYPQLQPTSNSTHTNTGSGFMRCDKGLPLR